MEKKLSFIAIILLFSVSFLYAAAFLKAKTEFPCTIRAGEKIDIHLNDVGWNKQILEGEYTLTMQMTGEIFVSAQGCQDKAKYFNDLSSLVFFTYHGQCAGNINVTAKDFNWHYNADKGNMYTENLMESSISTKFRVNKLSSGSDIIATIYFGENAWYYDITKITCNSVSADLKTITPIQTEYIQVVSNILSSHNYASGKWTMRIEKSDKAIFENAKVKIDGFKLLINNKSTFTGWIIGSSTSEYLDNYVLPYFDLANEYPDAWYADNQPFTFIFEQNLYTCNSSGSGKIAYTNIRIDYTVYHANGTTDWDESLTFDLRDYPPMPQITNNILNDTYYNLNSGFLTCPLGTTPTLSIGAVGELISYQWYKNDIAIAEANCDEYTLPAITDADNGSKYYCKVTNAKGSVKSNTAIVKICDPPYVYGYIRKGHVLTLSAGNDMFFPITDKSITGIYIDWGDGSNEQVLPTSWADLTKSCRANPSIGCYWPTVTHRYNNEKKYKIKVSYEFSSTEEIGSWIIIYINYCPIPWYIKGWKTNANKVLVSENEISIPSVIPVMNLLLGD